MAKEKIVSPTGKKIQTGSEMKSKTGSHPPYFQMIKEALMTHKEKKGLSPYAIAKLIEKKHKSVLPHNFRKTLSLQLKNSVSKGNLIKIKASYKLSSETTTKSKTIRQKESVSSKTRSSSRKSKKIVKKPDKMETKKMNKTYKKKKKPRQLKPIKSLGSKKALKASAA
ncbi:unnamed protein product [Cochlearia groenlandica]